MNVFLGALVVVGLGLELVVIGALLGGLYRRFPVLLLYLLVVFLTGVADAALFLGAAEWTAGQASGYYVTDTVRRVAAFLLVLDLVFRLARGEASLVKFRNRALALTAVGTLLSLALSSGSTLGLYMTELSRNLSFLTTVLVLGLWFALARARSADVGLLLVTAGMGLNMAGEAAAQSMIRLSPRLVQPGGIVAVTTHLLCLLVWWKACRFGRRSA